MTRFPFLLIPEMLSAIIFFGWISGAFAMDHHHHGERQKAASPFAKKNKTVKLHCLLRGHKFDTPCPKHLKADQKNHPHYQLASECRGSSIPVKPFSLDFETSFLESPVFIFSSYLFENDLGLGYLI